MHAAAAGNAAHDLANKTTDNGSPDDGDAGPAHDQQRLPGHPDRAARRGRPSRRCSASRRHHDSRLSSFSNRGLGKIDVAAPGSSILSTIVPNNGYGTQERHVDGVAARGRRARADEVGAPDVDAGADGRELRAQADDKACAAAPAARCAGTPADNSFFGEGIADALDAVS